MHIQVYKFHQFIYELQNSYCSVCQKSFADSSSLSKHNKSAALIKNKCKNTNILITQSSFVDCGEFIKEEDIKKEINEKESVDDPLSIQGDTTESESKNIVAELKEEGIDDDTLCSGDTQFWR